MNFVFKQLALLNRGILSAFCLSAVCICHLLAQGQTTAPPAIKMMSNSGAAKVHTSARSLPLLTISSREPPDTEDCSLSREEKQEITAALELLKNECSPPLVLAKLIKNRRPFAETDQEIAVYRENLPARFKDRLLSAEQIAASVSYRRALRIADRVFDQHQIRNRSILIYQSESPLFATWKTHFMLASTKALELLNEAELAGQIAHEISHLYFLDELKTALEADDDRASRIIELKCDAVAMLTLTELGFNPQSVSSGLSVMTRWLEDHNLIKPTRTHPGLCARQQLSNELAATLKSSLRRDPDNSAVVDKSRDVQASSIKSAGWLAFQAKIYYGRNDEDSTFVTNTKFVLLDRSLVEILKDEGFKFETPPVTISRSKGRGRNKIKEPPANDFDYLTAAVDLLKDARYGPTNRKNTDPPGDDAAILFVLLSEAIKRHTAASGETNLWGMGAFSAVKPGNYYLFGFFETEQETLVWHLPLLIKAGSNQVELDQYNTAVLLDN